MLTQAAPGGTEGGCLSTHADHVATDGDIDRMWSCLKNSQYFKDVLVGFRS